MIKILTTHGIAILVSLFVGAVSGYLYSEAGHTYTQLQIFTKGGGGLTNPLLECGVETDAFTIGERADLEKSVQAFVDVSKNQGIIADTTIYFRDLNNGDEDFIPRDGNSDPVEMGQPCKDHHH